MKIHGITAVVTFCALLAVPAFAEESKAKEQQPTLKAQTVCPVMGGKINKSSYADHNGQRVYFCCAGCETAFNKDPDKYIKKMAASGEKPAKLQTTCPVMGGKINKSSYTDYNGQRVYFCCAGCDAAFNKDPEKYIKQMQADGIVLESTPKKQKK